MKHDLTGQIRDAGYEALFYLGGFLAVSLHPTRRNVERVFQWIDDSQSRRQRMSRLEKRGLIEAGPGEGEDRWVGRLTDAGRAAFAGGRHPEVAWNREWDGKWRLLSFDLPRESREVRMKLRRWLVANDVGKIRGGIWICPDPVPGVAEIQVDPSRVLVFDHFSGGIIMAPIPEFS